MKIAILIGFDRCGSSFIGGLLSKHPQVSYIFQPFNSTEIHRTQYDIWNPDHSAPKTEGFLGALLTGHLDKTYIASDWFEKYSTSLDVDAEKLNVIKDTKLQFKVLWLKSKFPDISLYGIWRDPRAIVCSLMRNDFYRKWYGEDAFNAISRVIEREPLVAPYRKFMAGPLNDTEKMALIVAVRTHYMVEHLAADEWLVYEDILREPNSALNSFLQRFNIDEFEFAKYISEDFNVTGKSFESSDLWKDYFSRQQIENLDDIFSNLIIYRKSK